MYANVCFDFPPRITVSGLLPFSTMESFRYGTIDNRAAFYEGQHFHQNGEIPSTDQPI